MTNRETKIETFITFIEETLAGWQSKKRESALESLDLYIHDWRSEFELDDLTEKEYEDIEKEVKDYFAPEEF